MRHFHCNNNHQYHVLSDILFLSQLQTYKELTCLKAITPHMHLHCHVKDIIMDHGPVHSFWCFSFERSNGIMGSVSTNKRSLELKLMRKVILCRFLDSVVDVNLCNQSSSNPTISNSFPSAASSLNNMSHVHNLNEFSSSST